MILPEAMRKFLFRISRFEENKMKNIDQVVRKIRNSDANAFQQLFDFYHEDIFRFLRFKLNDSDTAEDIMQDVFVKVWEKRHTLRDNVSIKSFLFTIANRSALNHIRHSKIVMKFQAEHQYNSPASESPYLEFERTETHRLIVHAIADLPEKPRTAFLMSRFQDLTYNEVAQKLHISVKTVECHIGKALRLLRESLRLAA